jgi:hypothetical protein
MYKSIALLSVVAFAAARSAAEDKPWAENEFKLENQDTIKVTLKASEEAKPKTAPKSMWHTATNSKANGAASYAMLTTDQKNTFLVFTEKKMSGNDMPKAEDKIAVFAYDKDSSDLERSDGTKTFTLKLVKGDEKAPEAVEEKKEAAEEPKKADEPAKALEREEEEEFFGMLPFMGAAAFLAAPMMASAAVATGAAFAFAPFPFALATTSLSASLEKLGNDLEVMDVPIQGLEREEKFFPFAPFFMGPAMAAFGAAAAAPLFFAPALALGAAAIAR